MRGPFCLIGGKNRLADKIIARFPEHLTYVEPFAGGAQVFFRKPPSKVEVLNDLNDEIVNFFRICQQHYQELLRYTRFLLASRSWFDSLQRCSPETLTDVQRAARFLYLQKNAFAGMVVRRNYKAHVVNPPNFDPTRLPAMIKAVHDRLARVQLECLPYQQLLEKFDRAETFFYLDPPYYDKKLYRFNFTKADFSELAARLKTLSGKFLLSLNDVPEVRKLFSEFNIEPIKLAYSAQKKAEIRYRELFITNYGRSLRRIRQGCTIPNPLAE